MNEVSMEDFESAFLTREPLRRFLLYACSLNSESPDPITDALVTVMTEEVSYVVSRHGLTLFKGASPLPFTHMDPAQRHLIYQVIHSIRCEVHTYSAFATVEDPLTFSIENERITINLKFPKLDHKLVLSILADMVASSAKPSPLLYNIMLQRLSARVHIAKDVLAFVNEECKSKFTSSGATKHAQEQSQKSAAATR